MTSKQERRDKRQCPICGGDMRYERASVKLTVGDRLVVLREVPAWICPECQEKVLSNEVAKQVEKMLEAVKASSEHYQELQFKAA